MGIYAAVSKKACIKCGRQIGIYIESVEAPNPKQMADFGCPDQNCRTENSYQFGPVAKLDTVPYNYYEVTRIYGL